MYKIVFSIILLSRISLNAFGQSASSDYFQSINDIKITLDDKFEGPISKEEILKTDSFKLKPYLQNKFRLRSFRFQLVYKGKILFIEENKFNGNLSDKMKSAINFAPEFSWLIFDQFEHSFDDTSVMALPVKIKFLLVSDPGTSCPCDTTSIGLLINKQKNKILLKDTIQSLMQWKSKTSGSEKAEWIISPYSYQRYFILARVIKSDSNAFLLCYQFTVYVEKNNFTYSCQYWLNKTYPNTNTFSGFAWEIDERGNFKDIMLGGNSISQEDLQKLLDKFK